VAGAAEDLDCLFSRLHRDFTRVQLRHRALTGRELLAGRRHPRSAPHEQTSRVDLHLHVGELERDRLIQDDRAAERLPLLRVLERVLVRGARNAERLRADERTARLERAHRRLYARALAFTRTRDPRVELLLATEETPTGDAYVVEHDFGSVTRADAHLLE